jgi:DNA-binding NarL/FixJ family response regulator
VANKAGAHLFFCEQGQVLPRWREAFPSIRAAKLGAPRLGRSAAPTLVWVRLPHETLAVAALQAIPERLRSIPVVVMSDLPGDEEALAAFSAGARGYCNTHALPQVLEQVASVVLQGGLWIGESLMQRLLVATARLPVPPAAQPVAGGRRWSDPLTDREREVATTLARGASNKEIARTLGITERTVKAHVGAILEKLQVRDRLQLSLIVNGRAAPPGA